MEAAHRNRSDRAGQIAGDNAGRAVERLYGGARALRLEVLLGNDVDACGCLALREAETAADLWPLIKRAGDDDVVAVGRFLCVRRRGEQDGSDDENRRRAEGKQPVAAGPLAPVGKLIWHVKSS